MIIDERTYTCHPGKVKAFLEVYERLGKPIQWPIIGEPIGFFTTETGALCQVVHMWKYDGMGHREQCRLEARLRARLERLPGCFDAAASHP